MGNIVSGAIGLMGAEKAEDQSYAAGNELKALGREASALAAFKPFGITGSALGTPTFTYDESGKLTGAGYGANPQLAALQNQLLGGLSTYNPQALGQTAAALTPAAQSLFSAGQGYLSESPEAAKQRYISQQQALLAPQQEQALANVRNKLFQSGRTGLATGGTAAGGLQATNPEMAAYYNALAQQQAQLAAGAEQAAQQQQAFGSSLLSQGAGLLGQQSAAQTAGYAPIQAALQTAQGTEGLLSMPLQQALNLASLQSQAGANQGKLLIGPSTAGINTQLEGQQALTNAQYGFFGDLAGSALGAFSPSPGWLNM